MTDQFIQNLMQIRPENIPACAYRQARTCFLDYLACTLAGASTFSQKTTNLLNAMSDEIGTVSVLGLGRKTTLSSAALVNGFNAHVIELDDGHRKGALHVGASVFSSLLPVAEKENLSAQDFLYGAIIGYETTIRLACAVQPGNKLRGYHATGTCGTVGSAMAIAAALHFDFDQMKSAFSAAITSAAGILEMQEDDSDMKPLNVGRAAMDAVAAAYLGMARFKAPKDALNGKRGFLKVMTDEAKTSFLTDFSDGKLAIQQIYQKSYAACRHTHPAIEAALALRNKIVDNTGIPKPIKSIKVETYKLAIAGHDHRDIPSISSAKMSMPFSVALALNKGRAGMEDYTEENINSSDILSLAQKISIDESKELSALVPQKRASILHIILEDGTTYSHRVDYPKGEPENPLTEDEFKQKFIGLMKFSGISEEKSDKVLQNVYQNNFSVPEILVLLS